MAEPDGLNLVNTDFCRNLRTKLYYFSDEPPATYLAQDTASTGYWCLQTMGNFGPDDGYVCPDACDGNRVCYASTAAKPV